MQAGALPSACPCGGMLGEQAGEAPSRALLIILAFSNAGKNNELWSQEEENPGKAIRSK